MGDSLEEDLTQKTEALDGSFDEGVTQKTTALDDVCVGRVDRYELIRELGTGAYGAVFLAHDTEAGVEVALKMLPPLISHDTDDLEEVRKNFALVSKLIHSNIANLRHLHRVETADERAKEALGLTSGDYLVVMEYVPGHTLKSWQRSFKDWKVPVEQAVEVCRQVATALDFAHLQKVMHRDIKPLNIMLKADTDEVKVLDFGIAEKIHSTATAPVLDQSKGIVGTWAYMAPEQWDPEKREGAATDLYALAVLFYELVSGGVPFAKVFKGGKADLARIIHTVQDRMPEPLPELGKKQNAVLLRALAKNPRKRFGSCFEFVEALAEAGSPQKRAKGAKMLAALALVGLVGAATYFGVRHFNKVDGASSSVASEPPVSRPSATKLEASSTLLPTEQQAREAKVDAEMACEKLERDVVERGQGLESRFETLNRNLRIASDAYKHEDWKQAFGGYTNVLAGCEAVRQL
jgi:serine/threonine protein kinase